MRGGGGSLPGGRVRRADRGSSKRRFAIVCIRKVDSIITRRLYIRLLDDHSEYDVLEVPETCPRTTDEVRHVVEDVANQLEAEELTCIIQIEQLEDTARNTRTFGQLLAGLQSIGDLGEEGPAFILFLFGTPAASSGSRNFERHYPRGLWQKIGRSNSSSSAKSKSSSPGGWRGPWRGVH